MCDSREVARREVARALPRIPLRWSPNQLYYSIPLHHLHPKLVVHKCNTAAASVHATAAPGAAAVLSPHASITTHASPHTSMRRIQRCTLPLSFLIFLPSVLLPASAAWLRGRSNAEQQQAAIAAVTAAASCRAVQGVVGGATWPILPLLGIRSHWPTVPAGVVLIVALAPGDAAYIQCSLTSPSLPRLARAGCGIARLRCIPRPPCRVSGSGGHNSYQRVPRKR
jgi:hypothetical protein